MTNGTLTSCPALLNAAAAAAAFASRLDPMFPPEGAARGLGALELEFAEFTLTGGTGLDAPALAGGCMEGGKSRDSAALLAGRDVACV